MAAEGRGHARRGLVQLEPHVEVEARGAQSKVFTKMTPRSFHTLERRSVCGSAVGVFPDQISDCYGTAPLPRSSRDFDS